MATTQTRPFLLTANLIFLTAVLFVQVTAHPFYKYYVVAETGQNGIQNFDKFPSINAGGNVALIGQTRDADNNIVENIYIGNGLPNTLRNISPVSSNRRFGTFSPGIQINDNDYVIVRRFRPFIDLFNPPATWLQGWDAQGIDQFTDVVLGQPLLNTGFEGIYSWPTINNSDNTMIFTGLSGGQTSFGRFSPPNTRISIPTGAGNQFRPVLADNNTFVIRSGAAPYSILLYDVNFNLKSNVTQNMGFSYIGQSPGISDDGTVIIFYGEKPNDIGIFVAIIDPANLQNLPQIIKVAGLDGLLDPDSEEPPNSQTIYGELGIDNVGKSVFLDKFEPDNRLTVLRQQLGSSGIEDDTILACFTGTPKASTLDISQEKGIWVSRIDFKRKKNSPNNLEHSIRRPQPVIQVGEKFMGQSITNVSIYDAISTTNADYTGKTRQPKTGDHQLAFWINTSNGEKIIRGIYLDTDNDSFPDHWEIPSGGIDIDEDGTPELVLSKYSATPDRKDVFVEIDYMEDPSHSHQPMQSTLDAVRDAFQNAPVDNPDMSRGINLHLEKSQAIPHYDKIAFGRAVFSPRFADLKEVYLGNASDQQSSNKTNLIRARLLAFRYCIFGHDEVVAPGGVSEFGGDDLLVALAPLTPLIQAEAQQAAASFDTEWADFEAGVFMHELGHTLGLRHGGEDNNNYKPNYFSIMNYAYAKNRRGRDGSKLQTIAYLRTDRKIDYSRERLVPLNETHLDEALGLTNANQQHFPRAAFGNNGAVWITKSSGFIDWDVDGIIESSSGNNDVNYFASAVDSSPIPNEFLEGQNDWENLTYNFRQSFFHFGNLKLEANIAGQHRKPEFGPEYVEHTIFPEMADITPMVIKLNPSSIPAGSNNTVITIDGNGFFRLSKAIKDGIPQPTEYISENQLKFNIAAVDLTKEGAFQIFVQNGAIGKASNAVLLTITASPSPRNIAITKIDPKTIGAGEQKSVTIEATLAPSDTLLTNSVTLLRYNDKDELVSNLGQMFDDGTHGDRIAGDKIFTTQIVVNESMPQTIAFKASAAYKGQLKRLVSPPETLTVTQPPQSQQRSSPPKRVTTARPISPRP